MPNIPLLLSALTQRAVVLCWAHARLVLSATLLLTLACGWLAATHLGIDTRTDRLLAQNLPWRIEENRLNRAFPQDDNVLAIVIDGATPQIADKAARDLVAALLREPSLFPSVNYLQGAPFFQKNGLLFLDLADVKKLAEQLIGAQGLIGTLAADPSVNGLFSALNLALEGVKRHEIDAASLDQPFQEIARTLDANQQGKAEFLSWGKMLTDRAPDPRELKRIITVKPALDYDALSPGERASTEIRQLATTLGLTAQNGVSVSLTGDIALDDEEFASVAQGMGFATALSFGVVLLLLYAAIRTVRIVIAVLFTLVIGLVWTLAFAALAVGTLNLISVAFVVMFIGIAVDFGIQFSVRFRDEHERFSDLDIAARRTGKTIGNALFLAAVTTAVGFLAFVPTAYRGVSELGIIAGAGMIIAVILNLTVLPALLRVLQPGTRGMEPDFLASPKVDEWIVRRRKAILLVAIALASCAAAFLPRLHFDFNPLNLKDPKSGSMRTLQSLSDADIASPDTMQVLTPSFDKANDLATRLGTLPTVSSVLFVGSFIPPDQDKKLAVIRDAADLLLPTLEQPAAPPIVPDTVTLATLNQTLTRLGAFDASQVPPSFQALSRALQNVLRDSANALPVLQRALISGLPQQLAQLSDMLSPEKISLENLPDDLKREWVSEDGQYRIELAPQKNALDSESLRHFVSSVRALAPDASGEAYFIQSSGDTVWNAFKHAFFYALAGVTLVLALILRRIRDIALVIGPLLFSGLLTLATSVIIGLPINFANVIALPLLMGIGVAFNIYFVMNWRAGRTHPLQSSTARAVVFSALTTLTAVSSLALSPHPGTASLGKLLALCLAYTLLTALFFLPALLAKPATR